MDGGYPFYRRCSRLLLAGLGLTGFSLIALAQDESVQADADAAPAATEASAAEGESAVTADQSADAVSRDPGLPALEEIVVSARKREENLQEVPVAVNVLTSETIEKLNINSVSDVSKYTPSMIFDQGFSAQDTRITVRGLAPTRGRQNVAVLVDGIDVTGQAVQTNGGSLLINQRLFDLQQIEVVKGPQNALYGRTAFAGAINYITRKPSMEEWEARAYADVGNNQRTDLRFGASGPILGDSLAGGFNVAAWNDDGFYTNSVTGDGVGGQEGWGGSLSLAWDITDALTANFRTEYTDDELEQAPYTSITPTVPVPVPASAFGRVVSPAVPTIDSVRGVFPSGDSLAVTLSENPRTGVDYPGIDRELWRSSLIFDWDLGAVKFVSLTGYTSSDIDTFEDGRREGSIYAPGRTVGGEFQAQEETEQVSQEFRLLSNTDGAIDWVVGALYWQEEVDFVDGSINCVANEIVAPPPFGVPGVNCGDPIAAIDGAGRFADPWKRETEHWSVYGLVDWHFLDNWTVSLEGRYSDEQLDVTGPNRTGDPFDPTDDRPRAIDPRGVFFPTTILPRYGDVTGSVDDDFFAPKVTLQWSPTDTTMYYASWAQSYKPAGIAVVGALSGFDPVANEFDQEKLTVWELGSKTSWMEDRLILNGALFYQDFSDKQVNSQKADASGVLFSAPVNAASAEIYGLELEANWRATDHLSLYASYTFLDSEYDEFEQLSQGVAPIADAGNCTVVDPDGDPLTKDFCSLDLSGNDLEFVPTHSLLAGGEYRRELTGDMDWFVGADYIYQDERYTSAFNVVRFNSYGMLDLRLGVSADNWDALLYVNNATEDDTIKSSFANTYNQGISTAVVPGPFTFVLPLNQTPILPDLREVGLRLNFRFGS